MPEFGNPFSVLKHDRLLTHEELVRAIRFLSGFKVNLKFHYRWL